jgi:hypothetical protein
MDASARVYVLFGAQDDEGILGHAPGRPASGIAALPASGGPPGPLPPGAAGGAAPTPQRRSESFFAALATSLTRVLRDDASARVFVLQPLGSSTESYAGPFQPGSLPSAGGGAGAPVSFRGGGGADPFSAGVEGGGYARSGSRRSASPLALPLLGRGGGARRGGSPPPDGWGAGGGEGGARGGVATIGSYASGGRGLTLPRWPRRDALPPAPGEYALVGSPGAALPRELRSALPQRSLALPFAALEGFEAPRTALGAALRELARANAASSEGWRLAAGHAVSALEPHAPCLAAEPLGAALLIGHAARSAAREAARREAEGVLAALRAALPPAVGAGAGAAPEGGRRGASSGPLLSPAAQRAAAETAIDSVVPAIATLPRPERRAAPLVFAGSGVEGHLGVTALLAALLIERARDDAAEAVAAESVMREF